MLQYSIIVCHKVAKQTGARCNNMAFLKEFYKCNFRKLIYAALSKPLKLCKSHRRVTSKLVEKKVRIKKVFSKRILIGIYRSGFLSIGENIFNIFSFMRTFANWKRGDRKCRTKKNSWNKCWPSSDYIMTCSNLGKGKGVVAKTPGTSGF